MVTLTYTLQRMKKLGDVTKNGSFYSVNFKSKTLKVGISLGGFISTIYVRPNNKKHDFEVGGMFYPNMSQAIRTMKLFS